MTIFNGMTTQAFREPRRGEFKGDEFCPHQALIEKVVVVLEDRKKERGSCLLGEIVLIKETDDERQMLILLNSGTVWGYVFKNPVLENYCVNIIRLRKGFNLDIPPAQTFKWFKLQRDQNNETQTGEGCKFKRNTLLTVDEAFEGAVEKFIGWMCLNKTVTNLRKKVVAPPDKIAKP